MNKSEKKDYLDKLAKDNAILPTSMPKDERTFTDPSLRPPGLPALPTISEVNPELLPQLDGEGGDGDEKVATSIQPMQKTSVAVKSFSESWPFPKSMPQLDGEGDEEEVGDATIHDLDDQADLSMNQSMNAEESNMEADDLAKSMEGVKIRVRV